jgi:predicted transcriptional regulator
MNDNRTFTLDAETTEKLTAFGKLLDKDASTMINEALEQYFEAKEEEIARQDPMTNLSYDEFWDDMDFD